MIIIILIIIIIIIFITLVVPFYNAHVINVLLIFFVEFFLYSLTMFVLSTIKWKIITKNIVNKGLINNIFGYYFPFYC